MLTADQVRIAGLSGLAETLTAMGQAVQTAMANANLRKDARHSPVDIKGLGTPPMLNRRICKIHRVTQKDHTVSDLCVWLNFSASD